MVCGQLQYLFDYVCNTSLGIESRLRLFFKLIKFFKPTLSSTTILVSSKCLGILNRELVSNLMSQRTIDFANAIAHQASKLSQSPLPTSYFPKSTLQTKADTKFCYSCPKRLSF